MRGLVLIFLAVTIGTPVTSDSVAVKTSDSTPPIYQFFPLRTNFLRFSVKATNDVHICLANTPIMISPYYEIAIGGWENTRSILRNPATLANHYGSDLNPGQFQTIWVYMNDTEGSISAGKTPGVPLLYYKDPDYVKMSYFGIATGYGSTGEWNFDFGLFNCECCSRNHIPWAINAI